MSIACSKSMFKWACICAGLFPVLYYSSCHKVTVLVVATEASLSSCLVISVSNCRVGLIEWMKNTKPLKEFLQDALTNDEKKRYHTASEWQNEWLRKYGRIPGEWYKTMYK